MARLQTTAAELAAMHVQAQVVIGAHARTRSAPPSFLCISTEYWALPLWVRHLPLLDRVLSLVHGPGHLVLRIGGDSADRAFWSPVREMPEWAFEVTPTPVIAARYAGRGPLFMTSTAQDAGARARRPIP